MPPFDVDWPVASGALPAVSGANLTGLSSTVPPVIGSVRNGQMSVTAAAVSATFTADEVVVQTALGGAAVNLSGYSQTINLGSTGAGGMDTGGAPASGYVSLYAIYGTAGTSILACNVTTSQASVYAGSHMPTGYTYSALIGVWPTSASSQFVVGILQDRKVSIAATAAFTTSSSAASYTLASLATVIPPGARSAQGYIGLSSTSASVMSSNIAGSSTGIGAVSIASSPTTNIIAPFDIPLITAQTAYYNVTSTSGTLTYTIVPSAYTF